MPVAFNCCADARLDEDDLKKMVPCIRLDKIGAATSTATAEALAVNIGKEQLRRLVEYCKGICRKCGDECSQHQNQHCQDGAKACKECMEACEKLLA